MPCTFLLQKHYFLPDLSIFNVFFVFPPRVPLNFSLNSSLNFSAFWSWLLSAVRLKELSEVVPLHHNRRKFLLPQGKVASIISYHSWVNSMDLNFYSLILITRWFLESVVSCNLLKHTLFNLNNSLWELEYSKSILICRKLYLTTLLNIRWHSEAWSWQSTRLFRYFLLCMRR